MNNKLGRFFSTGFSIGQWKIAWFVPKSNFVKVQQIG